MKRNVKIPLTKGEYAIIDAEDSEKIESHRWHCLSGRYAARKVRDQNGKWKILLMHRLILDAPPHLECDHINGNGLDNRRGNLRLATRSNNQAKKAYNQVAKSLHGKFAKLNKV